MKTLFKATTVFFLLLQICYPLNGANANEFSYRLSLSNLNYTSDNSLEFDIYLLNTGKTDLRYLLGQYFLDFNPGIANGGILKLSIIGSGLPHEFIPRNPSIFESQIRLACNTLNVDKNKLPLVSTAGNGILAVRLKLETTADKFSDEPVNLNWSGADKKFRTKLFTYFNSSNYEITNYDSYEIQIKSKGGVTSISGKMPENFTLHQNYPNPFNPETKIRFTVPSANTKNQITGLTKVNITVYDISGREITNLVNNVFEPGEYEVKFSGNSVSSGVYFYRMTASGASGQYTNTVRMLLIK